MRDCTVTDRGFYPAVPVVFCWIGFYMIVQTIWRLRGKRGWVLRYHPGWIPTVFGILILNCLMRNFLLIGFGIEI